MSVIPVITIDGPSGSGKGTIAQLVAKKLKWHFLDSGALYRAVGWAVLNAKIDPINLEALQDLINNIKISMQVSDIGNDARVFCNNHDVTDEMRSENCGQMASVTSAIPLVRVALLGRQRAFRQAPGLVTDGRDMGTVVFPDATSKFYLTASAEIRAERRFNQLKQKGQHASLHGVLRELHVRDERDANRAMAPAKPANDAIVIDTTQLDINGVFELVLKQLTLLGLLNAQCIQK